MKRYFWTMCVVALFAVGFAASDEEDGTKEQSAKSKESTEMVDEKRRIPRRKRKPQSCRQKSKQLQMPHIVKAQCSAWWELIMKLSPICLIWQITLKEEKNK